MVITELRPLLCAATRAAVDKKAFQIKVLEVTELTSYADNFLICSAASERQVAAIADGMQRALREHRRRPLHVEGASRSDWVLLDYGDIVIHVLTEEKREYYKLDALWGDAREVTVDSLLVDDEEA